MSWSMWLKNPKTGDRLECKEPHFMFGPNVCLGGTTFLELDVTYNYGRIYRKVGFSFNEDLYGKTGKEAVHVLHEAIEKILELDNEKETEAILKEDKERLKRAREDYRSGKITQETFNLISNERDPDDYWFPSPKNAITALENLVRLSEMGLVGVWEGD